MGIWWSILAVPLFWETSFYCGGKGFSEGRVAMKK